MMYQDIIQLHKSKYKKMKIYYPLCQTYSPTVFVLNVDFQNVDQHAGSKWLIHDTKRRKDNQLQSQNGLLSVWRKAIKRAKNWFF